MVNESGSSIDVYVWEAGGAPSYSSVSNNNEFGVGLDNPGTAVLQFGRTTFFSETTATVTVASRRSATHCFFQVQAIRQG